MAKQLQAAVSARLLDLTASAAYLGNVCEATVRGLVASGALTPVRLPSTRRPGEQNRRLLFDVRDLDALIDSWKTTSSNAPNATLSKAAIKGWKSTPQRRSRGAA